MKKIIAIVMAVALVGIMAVVFTACGGDNNTPTTTYPATDTVTTTTSTTENPGIVTDESEEGENGALGELMTDESEMLSEVATDISRAFEQSGKYYPKIRFEYTLK